MTAPGQVPFDPELLQRHFIIRPTPAWKNVDASMKRLRGLQQSSIPYDQMDLDRDDILGFYSNLRTASDSIALSMCLAAHLARFSKTQAPEQRLKEGFQALSDGLELASFTDLQTKNELERCAQAAFPGLKLQFPPMNAIQPAASTQGTESTAQQETQANAEAAAVRQQNASSQPPTSPTPAQDPWRTAVEDAVTKVGLMERPPMDVVIQKAAEAWQNRFVALLGSPNQPEVSPDVDYLRCRAANHPLGMVLRGRMKNVSLREWNEVYMSGISVTGATTPVPLWFAFAALGALGFDVPREFSSPAGFTEGGEVLNFTSKLPTTSPRKGIAVIRLTADSQTAEWKINPSMPALILTAEEAQRSTKVSLQKYFQERLNGILIEVGRDETAAAARTRAGINRLNELFPNIRQGLLILARTGSPDEAVNTAVKPADAWDAFLQAFGSSPTASPSAGGAAKAA